MTSPLTTEDAVTIWKTTLIIDTRELATRARRARMTGTLEELRHIGEQLNATTRTDPTAPDVITAARTYLNAIRQDIEHFERVTRK